MISITLEDATLATRINRMADDCERSNSPGPYSTGEKLAVAVLLDRHDWLRAMDYTILDAIDRIGDDWMRAVMVAARQRRDR
jgi:hypothetical protein